MKKFEDDDGRTIASMDVDGMPNRRRKMGSGEKIELERDEKRVLRKVAFFTWLKISGVLIAIFGIAFCVIFLWLH